MNKFVTSKYDKFKQKTVIQLKNQITIDVKSPSKFVSDVTLGFRKVVMEGLFDSILIDVSLVSQSGGFGLSRGQLQMIVDGERFNFEANESFSVPYLESFHKESDYYELTLEELKTICDASSIEVRVTNGDDDIDFTSTIQLQWAARVLYNAVIDENAYTNEILAIGNKNTLQKYEEANKKEITLIAIACIAIIIIGCFCSWWLIILGATLLGAYLYNYSRHKKNIANSKQLS